MFLRLLYQSFHRQRRSKLLAGVAIALGAAVATAVLAVATGVGDRMGRELRAFGANIIVYPAADNLEVRIGSARLRPTSDHPYLQESDLPRIEGIFWRHNVLGFAPFLQVPVVLRTANGPRDIKLVGTYFAKAVKYGDQSFVTGVHSTHPWWRVEGRWPDDASDEQVLAGSRLAQELRLRVGDSVSVSRRQLQVVGILSTGSDEDNQMVAPLHLAQQIGHLPGAVRAVYVSALTKPEDSFARRNPVTLSPADRDRWYCSPYANSIAFQLMEALPHSHAEQIRRVAQSEGQVLSRISGLLLLIALAALVAAALAVAAATATAMMQRQHEIGLMKALGAGRGRVAAIFVAEGAILALLGGIIGFALGALLARAIGKSVFGAALTPSLGLFPIVLLVAVLVVAAGSVVAIRRAAFYSPALALRGEP